MSDLVEPQWALLAANDCRCPRFPDHGPCGRQATGEDRLCDPCRQAMRGDERACSGFRTTEGRSLGGHYQLNPLPVRRP